MSSNFSFEENLFLFHYLFLWRRSVFLSAMGYGWKIEVVATKLLKHAPETTSRHSDHLNAASRTATASSPKIAIIQISPLVEVAWCPSNCTKNRNEWEKCSFQNEGWFKVLTEPAPPGPMADYITHQFQEDPFLPLSWQWSHRDQKSPFCTFCAFWWASYIWQGWGWW